MNPFALVGGPALALLFSYPLFDLFYSVGMAVSDREGDSDNGREAPSPDESTVTIQVPIYNSRERLLPLLRSIRRTRLRCPIQLLDSSDDGDTTALIEDFFGAAERVERADSWTKTWDNVRLVHFREKGGSKAWALQNGTETVATPLIAVFDADWELDPRFFEKLLPAILADDRIGFVQAAWGSSNKNASWVSRADAVSIEAEHRVEDVLRSRLSIPFTIHGSAFIVRTDLVKRLGWRDRFLSEDVDLAMRIFLEGYRAVYAPEHTCYGETCTDLTGFYRQKARWIEGRSQMLRTHFPGIIKSNRLSWWRKLFLAHYLGYFLRFPAALLALSAAVIVGKPAPTLVFAAVGLQCMSKSLMNLLASSGVERRDRLAVLLEPALFWLFAVPYAYRSVRGLFLVKSAW